MKKTLPNSVKLQEQNQSQVDSSTCCTKHKYIRKRARRVKKGIAENGTTNIKNNIYYLFM
jgi:hypothetical protein